MVTLTPVEATLLVAFCSLIVMPFVVWWIKHYLEQRKKAKQAELDERYVTQEVHEMTFDQLAKTQAKQHQENRDFLDTIRTEALQREGKVLGSVETMSTRLSGDIKNLRDRVDFLFQQRSS